MSPETPLNGNITTNSRNPLLLPENSSGLRPVSNRAEEPLLSSSRHTVTSSHSSLSLVTGQGADARRNEVVTQGRTLPTSHSLGPGVARGGSGSSWAGISGGPAPTFSQPVSVTVSASGSRASAAIEHSGSSDERVFAQLLKQAAVKGDLDHTQHLISNGLVKATTPDSQGISALHWAAINNHCHIAHYLVTHGADVHYKAGDLRATPIHWASRQGHTQMVTYLILRGANIEEADAQGFTPLHLAVHSSSPLLVLYLLHTGANPNAPDHSQQTPLMWATLQGKDTANCLKTLARFGADVQCRDQNGDTVLHWAVKKQNAVAVKVLANYGADELAVNSEGLSAIQMATEMRCAQWLTDLLTVRQAVVSRGKLELAFWVLPNIQLWVCLLLLTFTPAYIGLPVCLVIIGLVQTAVIRFVVPVYRAGLIEDGLWARSSNVEELTRSEAQNHTLYRSPYLPAFVQSVICAGLYVWAAHILPSTLVYWPMHALLSGLLAILITSFVLVIRFDPGYIPPLTHNPEVEREIVTKLAKQGTLDHRHFCYTCRIQRPPRSKHCRVCDRCVRRFDHHCPWIRNCVGSGNHGMFLVFLYAATGLVVVFVYLVVRYFQAILPAGSLPTPQCIWPRAICNAFYLDSMTIHVTLVLFVLLMYTFVLSCFHTFLACTNQTTNESVNASRYREERLEGWEDLSREESLNVVKNCARFWREGGSGCAWRKTRRTRRVGSAPRHQSHVV